MCTPRSRGISLELRRRIRCGTLRKANGIPERRTRRADPSSKAGGFRVDFGSNSRGFWRGICEAGIAYRVRRAALSVCARAELPSSAGGCGAHGRQRHERTATGTLFGASRKGGIARTAWCAGARFARAALRVFLRGWRAGARVARSHETALEHIRVGPIPFRFDFGVERQRMVTFPFRLPSC